MGKKSTTKPQSSAEVIPLDRFSKRTTKSTKPRYIKGIINHAMSAAQEIVTSLLALSKTGATDMSRRRR